MCNALEPKKNNKNSDNNYSNSGASQLRGPEC